MKRYSYKIRLYPNNSQKEFLARQFGCCRLVYNYMLALKQNVFKEGTKYSKFDLIKQLTILKHREEYLFLSEVYNAPLQQAIVNVDDAFVRMYSKQTKYPKFKNKHSRQSFTYAYPRIKDNRLWLPKHKSWIKFSDGRTIEGKLKKVTISKNPDGTYWASILAEQGYVVPEKPKVLGETIGIDLGLKDFAILSDGTKIINPRFAEHYAYKIKAAQRHLSRKHKGSKRYEKQRLKLAKLHKRVKYLRHEFVHSLVNWLLSENQTICIETLNVKKMMQGSKLAKSIASASWSEFIRVLKYKAEWLGKQVIQIPRYAASTKKCCACGCQVEPIPLSVREWTCPYCGVHHDRDINAARNILLQAVNLALGGNAPVHSWIDIADLCTLGIQVCDTKMKREYRNNVPIVVH